MKIFGLKCYSRIGRGLCRQTTASCCSDVTLYPVYCYLCCCEVSDLNSSAAAAMLDY